MANDITTNTFSAATQIKSAEVNTNFDDLAEMQDAKCEVNMGSLQSISATIPTLLQFDTEVSDPGSNFDNSASNYSFTAPIAGIYFIQCQIGWDDIDDGALGRISIYKNAGEIHYQQTISAAANFDLTVSVQKTCVLAANDVIQFYGYQTDIGARNIKSSNLVTFATIHLLSV